MKNFQAIQKIVENTNCFTKKVEMQLTVPTARNIFPLTLYNTIKQFTEILNLHVKFANENSQRQEA